MTMVIWSTRKPTRRRKSISGISTQSKPEVLLTRSWPGTGSWSKRSTATSRKRTKLAMEAPMATQSPRLGR
jgi:hypothetical protein